MTESSLTDTSDMIGLHRVFRDAGTNGPALVRDAADQARTDLVASYLTNVLCLLKSHHEGEDELVTPRLASRADEDEVAAITRIASQHEPVVDLIEHANAALAAWQAAPTEQTAAAAVAAVEGLTAELTPHLDEEEQTVLPIAARHMTQPEWGELPGHGMRTFTGDKLWLILGLIREQMTAAQIDRMDANMPPPVKQMWDGVGRASFEDFVSQLRS